MSEDFHAAHPTGWAESISGIRLCVPVRHHFEDDELFLFVGFTDPYIHTYSESYSKIIRGYKYKDKDNNNNNDNDKDKDSDKVPENMTYFWNPDDLLIPNMMIDTSPWSSCSSRSTWLACYGHTISSTGLSVSAKTQIFPVCNFLRIKTGLKRCLCFDYGYKLTKRAIKSTKYCWNIWKRGFWTKNTCFFAQFF